MGNMMMDVMDLQPLEPVESPATTAAKAAEKRMLQAKDTTSDLPKLTTTKASLMSPPDVSISESVITEEEEEEGDDLKDLNELKLGSSFNNSKIPVDSLDLV